MDRPSRRKTKKNTQVSASHFVGYVEDGESVEAIMKKFEAMAEYERELSKTRGTSVAVETPQTVGSASPSSSDIESSSHPAFSDAQLEEIFKRTSGFTVKSAALSDTMNDIEYVDALLGDQMDEEWGVGTMDDSDDEFWHEDEDDFGRRRNRSYSLSRPRAGKHHDRQSIIDRYKVMHFQLQDRQGNFFTVRRRVKQVDPLVPTYVKIPPEPISVAWCHTIQPLKPKSSTIPGSRCFEHDIMKMSNQFIDQLGDQFQAICLDPPLLLPDEEPHPNKISIEQLSKLAIPKLCSNGFLFVWIDKENIYPFVQMAEAWKFRCVENICWIRMTPNNRLVKESSAVFNKSKLTMLVLRRDGEIELRHQRSPDCVYDFIRPRTPGELSEEKPEMYELIETLLPQAIYSAENPSGTRLLELWARPGTRRCGWTTVVHKPPQT